MTLSSGKGYFHASNLEVLYSLSILYSKMEYILDIMPFIYYNAVMNGPVNMKLKLARVEKQLTQQELADLVEVTRQTIGLIEKGTRRSSFASKSRKRWIERWINCFGRTKKMRKKPINLDEREMKVFRSISTTLYLITLFSLIGMQLYRQFVLHQPQAEWNDIAILITFNVVVMLGSVLYLSGTINPKKIKSGYLIAGYLGFVLLGFLFTIFKYTVLLGQHIGLGQILDYLLTVITISGLLVVAWGLLAFLGSRRIEKLIK